jgi:hypothetical protein
MQPNTAGPSTKVQLRTFGILKSALNFLALDKFQANEHILYETRLSAKNVSIGFTGTELVLHIQ